MGEVWKFSNHFKTCFGRGPYHEIFAFLFLVILGGFSAKGEYETVENYSLVILPDFTRISIPNQNLPLMIGQAVDAIIKNKGVSPHEEFKSWEDEEVKVPLIFFVLKT